MADTINPSSVPVAQLLARFQEAKKYREKYDSTWERNWKLYCSKHWDGISKLWFQSEPVFNKVFEFVEIMRSMLADNKWGIDSIPVATPSGTDQETIDKKADLVNKLLDHLWEDCNIQSKLAQVFIHVFLKGTGFLKCSFDPDRVSDAGIGQIEVDVVDPFYMYVDPDATCVEDAAFIIEAKSVSLRYIARRFPEKLAEVLEKGGGNSLDSAPRGTEGLGLPSAEEGKRVDIYECWYHDASIVVLEETEDEIKVGAKYPTGRYTLMTSTGVVLEDKKNPYETFPYIRFVEIPMPGEFWGGCTIDKAADIQLTINDILRAIVDNGKWLVHGIWIADDTSGVTARSLATYGPRDVVVKRQGSEVRRDSGQQLPPHLFQMYQDAVEAFDRVVGLPDVLRGIVPSRQPVETTRHMLESGEVRTRERARQVETSLRALGMMMLSIVQAHWVDKRSIRQVRATGGLDTFQLSKDDLEGWQFEIAIRPCSTLPMDRASALAKALELRGAGLQIPDTYLLRLSGLPGIEQAIAEMEAAAKEAENDPSNQVETQLPEGGDVDEGAGPGDQSFVPGDEALLPPEELALLQSGEAFP